MTEGDNTDLRSTVEELRELRKRAGQSEPWPMRDSSLESFAWEFANVIPGEVGKTEDRRSKFTNYIKETLVQKSRGPLVAVEFGGRGSAFFRGFPKNLFQKTVGVHLSEEGERTEEEVNGRHITLEADILNKKTYHQLRNILGENKANLIISRMGGPLEEITLNPIIWAKVAREWYKLLAENGLMFVQYRFKTGDRWISDKAIEKDPREKLMREWAGFIKQNYEGTLEVQLGDWSFRLYKKVGAPAELPILPSFDKTPIVEVRK